MPKYIYICSAVNLTYSLWYRYVYACKIGCLLLLCPCGFSSLKHYLMYYHTCSLNNRGFDRVGQNDCGAIYDRFINIYLGIFDEMQQRDGFIGSHFPEVVAVLFWGCFPRRLCSLALYSVLHFFYGRLLMPHFVRAPCTYAFLRLIDERQNFCNGCILQCYCINLTLFRFGIETIDSGNFSIFFKEYI